MFECLNEGLEGLESVGRKTIIKVYDELERRGLVVRRRGTGSALTCKPDAPPRQTFLDAPLVVCESAGTCSFVRDFGIIRLK